MRSQAGIHGGYYTVARTKFIFFKLLLFINIVERYKPLLIYMNFYPVVQKIAQIKLVVQSPTSQNTHYKTIDHDLHDSRASSIQNPYMVASYPINTSKPVDSCLFAVRMTIFSMPTISKCSLPSGIFNLA